MRKLFALLLAFMLLTTSALAADIYVDIWKLEPSASPVVVNGCVLAPAQDIFTALGAAVTPEPDARSALIARGTTQIWIQADNPTAFVSGAAITLPVPAQLVNGQLMVPVQFAAEALNCGYKWDAGTQTAAVVNILKGQAIYIAPDHGKRWHIKNPCGRGSYREIDLAEAIGNGYTPCGNCVLRDARYAQLGNSSPPAPSTPAPTQSPVQTQAPGPAATPPAVQTAAPAATPSAQASPAPAPQTPVQAPQTPVSTQPPAAAPQQPAPAQTPSAAGRSTYQGPTEEPLWLIVDSTRAVPEVRRPQMPEPQNDSQPGTPSWLVL